jgi:hypothetical protein
MSPPYLPTCGISKPFQVNLCVPSLNFKINSLLCAHTAHEAAGVLVIFHAKCVILTMSVYRLSLHERMVGNRDACPELLKKWKVMVWKAPVNLASHGLCL